MTDLDRFMAAWALLCVSTIVISLWPHRGEEP